VEPRPFEVGELRSLLEEKRQALASRGEIARYEGIVGEYAQRIGEFRRELREIPTDSPEAGFLKSRIENLADCTAAHQRRVPQLKADAAEHARIDRRQDFLDRAVRSGQEQDPSTAAVPEPELPASGGPFANAPPESGGQVRLSGLSR
jgi:tetrahydromethanopterin S-methyltransferase subunit G